MDTVVSSVPGSRRGSQVETAPFPLELEIVARRKRVVRREGRSQDETAPFPLEFEVVARKAQQSQDETSPFLLEFMVILDGKPAFVRTARPPRSRGAQRSSPRVLPRLKWHGVDASRELREYAARIASGEELPPYSGPILANGESPRARPAPSPRVQHPVLVDDSKALVKLALALLVMTALIVAAAVLGDDAQLRSVGQSISGSLTGRGDSLQTLPAAVSATAHASGSSAPQR
jgi:hypothetical protein